MNAKGRTASGISGLPVSAFEHVVNNRYSYDLAPQVRSHELGEDGIGLMAGAM